MLEKSIIISDLERNCMHPFSELVRTACQFQSKLLLSCDSKQINAKSIMGMMAFDLTEGTVVKITADGIDEAAALEALEAFLTCRS